LHRKSLSFRVISLLIYSSLWSASTNITAETPRPLCVSCPTWSPLNLWRGPPSHLHSCCYSSLLWRLTILVPALGSFHCVCSSALHLHLRSRRLFAVMVIRSSPDVSHLGHRPWLLQIPCFTCTAPPTLSLKMGPFVSLFPFCRHFSNDETEEAVKELWPGSSPRQH
jgi:hypothetical protein